MRETEGSRWEATRVAAGRACVKARSNCGSAARGLLSQNMSTGGAMCLSEGRMSVRRGECVLWDEVLAPDVTGRPGAQPTPSSTPTPPAAIRPREDMETCNARNTGQDKALSCQTPVLHSNERLRNSAPCLRMASSQANTHRDETRLEKCWAAARRGLK